MSDLIILPPEAKGTAYALLFAVENYLEGNIDTVTYAERDASDVKAALLELGYAEPNVELTVNTAATMASIRYAAKQLAGTAKLGDSVFFFFAGHGYTWQGRNYLMAYDTRRGDIEGTAVLFQELFTMFEKSECRRVMFFLDCCHSGVHLGGEERGVLEDLSTDELQAYFRDARFRVVFSACDKGEKSYPSHQFKHGYWTYHLLRALRGEEPGLLDAEGRLRSTSLQDYLRIEVPKQLALQSTERRSQNPKMFGDVSGTFVVADLSILMAGLAAQRKAQAVGLKDATLRTVETGQVRSLSGFDKSRGHKPPAYYNRTTKNWVAGLAEDQLNREMEKYHQAIQGVGIYKRRELGYDPPIEGSAAIRTPDFEFSITYSQNTEDPATYDVVRALTRLSKPELLDEDWFNKLFLRVFDEVVFEFSSALNVDEFIDLAEEIDELEVKYSSDAACCSIWFGGFNGNVTLFGNHLIFHFRDAETPRAMADQLQLARALLLGMPGMQKALPL